MRICADADNTHKAVVNIDIILFIIRSLYKIINLNGCDICSVHLYSGGPRLRYAQAPLAVGGTPPEYKCTLLKCHSCSFTNLPHGLRSVSAQGPSDGADGRSIEQVSSLSEIDQNA